MDKLFQPERLCTQLQEHLYTEAGMQVLKHPLVFGVPYIPAMNRMYNEQLEAKKRALQKLWNDRNSNRRAQSVWVYERPYRLEGLQRAVATGLAARVYWQTVAAVWIDSENIFECREEWDQLWLPEDPYLLANRRQCMTAEERRDLKALGKSFTIYHGEEEPGEIGRSWTTSLKVAQWFAKRFGGNRKVYTGTVKSDNVIGYLRSRNEDEILVEDVSKVELHG